MEIDNLIESNLILVCSEEVLSYRLSSLNGSLRLSLIFLVT